MVRQRWFLIFIFLIMTVFLFTRKEEAIVIKSVSPVSNKPVTAVPDEGRRNSFSRTPKQTLKQTDSSSESGSGYLGMRRKVPAAFIGKANTVDLPVIKNARTERSPFFEGTPWKIWTGVTAYPRENGKTDSSVIGEVNGFYLVEAKKEHANVRNFSSKQPLVVIDQRLDLVGVVTGVFSVTLREGSSTEILKRISGIKILNSFPAIRTYYITAELEPFDLQALQESLANESDIENFHAEILSRQYEKN